MGRIDGTSERPHHFQVSKSRFGRFHTGNLEDVFFLEETTLPFSEKRQCRARPGHATAGEKQTGSLGMGGALFLLGAGRPWDF